MKRFLSVLLIFALFLTGCRSKQGLKKPVQEPGGIPPAELISLEDETWQKTTHQWNFFYWQSLRGVEGSIDLEENEAGIIRVSFDGTSYTVQGENFQRTYRHLLHCPYQDENGYTECLLLSNDQEMTAKACAAPEDGTILFRKRLDFDLMQSSGDVPEVIKTMESYDPGLVYGKDSFFRVIGTENNYTVFRYDYAGTRLSVTTDLQHIGSIWELEDGGFLLACESYNEKYYAVQCYDAQGTHRWTKQFSALKVTHIKEIFEKDGKLYLFGEEKYRDESSDLSIWIMAPDGTVIDNRLLGGSDFESLYHVEQTKTGFKLYGTTQSNNGPFPYSNEGFPVPFEAQMDYDLELTESVEIADVAYYVPIGYYKGERVYSTIGGSSVHSSHADILESASSVFDFEGGYVVKKMHQLGIPVMLQDPYMNFSPNYYEYVYTGYNAQNEIIWQYVGPVST